MRVDWPVARWQWGVDLFDRRISGDSLISETCTIHARLQDVLVGERISVGETITTLLVKSVADEAGPDLVLEFRADGSLLQSDLRGWVCNETREFNSKYTAGTVVTHSWLNGEFDPRDEDALESSASSISVDHMGFYLSVTLETYIDVWMPFDLRGRSQPQLFEYNAPRLASALAAISGIIGVEAVPCERSKLARATATGVENFIDDDGYAEDVWFRYFGESSNDG